MRRCTTCFSCRRAGCPGGRGVFGMRRTGADWAEEEQAAEAEAVGAPYPPQGDRHSENAFITEEGGLKLIDTRDNLLSESARPRSPLSPTHRHAATPHVTRTHARTHVNLTSLTPPCSRPRRPQGLNSMFIPQTVTFYRHRVGNEHMANRSKPVRTHHLQQLAMDYRRARGAVSYSFCFLSPGRLRLRFLSGRGHSPRTSVFFSAALRRRRRGRRPPPPARPPGATCPGAPSGGTTPRSSGRASTSFLGPPSSWRAAPPSAAYTSAAAAFAPPPPPGALRDGRGPTVYPHTRYPPTYPPTHPPIHPMHPPARARSCRRSTSCRSRS